MPLKAVASSTSVIAITRAQIASLMVQGKLQKYALYFISDENKLAVGASVASLAESTALTIAGALAITSAATATVLENAAFSFPLVANQTATWSITGGADAARFTLSGSTLSMTAKDFESPTDANGDNVYVVTVQATASGTSVSQTISVTVSNVLEGTLAPTTATFVAGATSGSTIATITGLDVGANETVASVSPSDRLAVSSGNKLVVGLTAATAGTINATVTTSAGRTLTITITVTAAASDTSPDAFTFADNANTTASQLVYSNSITVSGIDTATPISINDGQYRINGGAYVSTSGTVVNGDVITLRQSSLATAGATRTITLTIGDKSATWNIITANAAVTFPTISQTTATIDNSADPSTVVIDMPALATDEKRYFIAVSCPDFPIAIGTSGKLLRGLTQWAVGAVGTGTIRQDINGTIKNTNVTITTTVPNTAVDSTRYMFAATRVAWPNSISALTDSQLSRLSRMNTMSADYATSSIRAVFVNTAVDGSGGNTPELEPTTSLTLDFVTFEYNNAFYPVTFGGQSSVVIPPGGQVICDPVMNGASPLIVPARSRCWWRTSDSHPSGGQRPAGQTRMTSYGEGIEYTATPQTSKKTSGTISLVSITGTNANFVYGPAAVVAQGWDGRPVVLMLGDSLTSGSTSMVTLLDESGCAGYIARGFDSVDGGGRTPHLNWGVSGSRVYQCSSRNTGAWKRRAEVIDALKALNTGSKEPFTTIFDGYINNDVGITSTGNTATQLKATLQAHWNFLKTEYPTVRLVQGTGTPRTSDSNNAVYTTTADQTVTTINDRSNPTTDAQARWTTSDWIKTKPSPLDAIIDIDAFVSDGAKWKARPYSGTLAADYAVGNATLSMTAKPEIGEILVLNPGTASKVAMAVTGATGTGPYAVSAFVAPGVAIPSGSPIKAAMTSDGALPSILVNKEAAVSVVVPAKASGIFGTTATGSSTPTVTHTFNPSAATPKTLAANWSELPDTANVVVLLKAGDHGTPVITGARTNKIIVLGEAGAVVGKLAHKTSSSKWTYTGVKFRDYNPGYDTTPKKFMNNSSGETQEASASVYADQTTSDIVFDNCAFCTAEDSRDWTDTEWVYKGRNSQVKLFGSNSKVINSKIYNVLNGISVGGIKVSGVNTSGYVIENNYFENVAVDYMQHAGDSVTIRSNTGRLSRHCYGNFDPSGQNLHGDFIHGYGANNAAGVTWASEYSNILIESNDFDEGPYSTQGVQGINTFDGKWNNVVVRGNKVRNSALHAMSWYHVNGLTIENNDIAPVPVFGGGGTRNVPNIVVSAAKYFGGGYPCTNVIVRNNKTPGVLLWKPGVYASVYPEGSGYSAGGTTITFGAPIKSPNAQAAGTAFIRSGSNGIARVDMSERAATSYSAAPSVTLNGDGSGAALIARYMSPAEYVDTSGNVKQDGTAVTLADLTNPL